MRPISGRQSPASPDHDCPQPAGVFHPVIDRNACEGKAECVAVCPVKVFEMGVLPLHERKPLTLIGKMKGFTHGWSQAFATNAAACEACGVCVKNCPEKAITLSRVPVG